MKLVKTSWTYSKKDGFDFSYSEICGKFIWIQKSAKYGESGPVHVPLPEGKYPQKRTQIREICKMWEDPENPRN